jgi:stage II sporulation protein D
MTTRVLTFTAAATACLALAAPATGATRFIVRGAGFGHGVGMSQYGAYGFASNGSDYRSILAHYYTGTELGSAAGTKVRVLLEPSVGRTRVTNASRAAGRRLDPDKTYAVRRGSASTVELLSPRGRRLKTVTAPLRIKGTGGRIHLVGVGDYRGTMEFRPSGLFGVMTVNAVDLENYVRGVVSRESPSSWPIEALKAQAVAARTYAITTTKGGTGWDHYPDTRSQVYGGIAAETESTDEAVAATDGEVVTYDGEPVVTYFFSTSGGRTEDVENTSLGNEPLPWLKSVEDPYDDASPKHRWGPYRWRLSTADRRLGSLVKGSFRGIKVLDRGRSPRIISADIIGTRGRTRVDGATLRARLGLYDTWAYFTTIKSGKRRPKPQTEDSPTGGVTPEARATRLARQRLTGRVWPARRGSAVKVQRREGKRWRAVGTAGTDARGRYAFAVDREGTYRVRYRGDSGPRVRIR